MSPEIGTVLAILTAWRMGDEATFKTLCANAGPNDLAVAIGMLNLSMKHLARHAGVPEEQYFQQFALVMARP